MARADDWDLIVEAFQSAPVGTGWVRTACPICERDTGRADKKQSLGLNRETAGYNCFKCGSHGKLPTRFMLELGEWDPTPREPPPREPVELAIGYMPLYGEPWESVSELSFARDYLTGRGLQQDALAEAGVGAVIAGRLGGRVIVPIPDYDNPELDWIGWVSRDATGTAERPYLYPRNMDRLGLLYNAPALWVETETPVYVVEGTLDALALWPDAVAVLGKPLDSQIALLARARRPVVVALDGDAWALGQTLAWTLRMYNQRSGAVRLPPGLDPDEIPRDVLDRAALCSLASTDAYGKI